MKPQTVNLTSEYLQGAQAFEGCSLRVYVCPAGFLTVGIGHLIRERESKLYLGGMTLAEAKSLHRTNKAEFLRRTAELTLEEAHELKRRDMEIATTEVEKRLVKWGVHDAPNRCLEILTDLAFNGGPGFLDGTIAARMRAKDYDGAVLFSPKFCLAEKPGTGKLVPYAGLTFRRYSFVWYYFTGEFWRIGSEGNKDADWLEVEQFLTKLSEILRKKNLKNLLPYPNNLRKVQN